MIYTFFDLYPKRYEYVTVIEQIIRCDKMNTIYLSTYNRISIIVCDVAYIQKCYFNLILLGQL